MSNTTKMLGGWGWVAALVLALIPGLHILSLAGAVCVFIAMFRAGRELNRPQVNQPLILTLVLSLVAGVVFMFFVGASLIGLMLHHDSAAGAVGFGAGMMVGGLVAWACYIAGAWFWYQACTTIAEAGNAPLLKTGGLLGFIGAITVIVFGLGGLVALVGSVLQAIAFFNAPEGRAGAPPTTA
ncbi:MAG: DUF996 domain-containing protein [Nevskia sp.]|nr:DUF996 domain-containing protein [Nevskia sp.]